MGTRYMASSDTRAPHRTQQALTIGAIVILLLVLAVGAGVVSRQKSPQQITASQTASVTIAEPVYFAAPTILGIVFVDSTSTTLQRTNQDNSLTTLAKLPGTPTQVIVDSSGHSAAALIPLPNGAAWHIFDLDLGAEVGQLPATVQSLAFSKDGLRILYFNNTKNRPGLYTSDRSGHTPVLLRAVDGYVYAIAWLADDTYALLLQDIPGSGTPLRTRYVALSVSTKAFTPLINGDLPPLVAPNKETVLIGSSGTFDSPALTVFRFTPDGPQSVPMTVPASTTAFASWSEDSGELTAVTSTGTALQLSRSSLGNNQTTIIANEQTFSNNILAGKPESFAALVGELNGMIYYLAATKLERFPLAQ